MREYFCYNIVNICMVNNMHIECIFNILEDFIFCPAFWKNILTPLFIIFWAKFGPKQNYCAEMFLQGSALQLTVLLLLVEIIKQFKIFYNYYFTVIHIHSSNGQKMTKNLKHCFYLVMVCTNAQLHNILPRFIHIFGSIFSV